MRRFAYKEMTVRAKRTKITARQDTRMEQTESASIGRTFVVNVEFTTQFPALCDSLYAETEIKGLLINLI